MEKNIFAVNALFCNKTSGKPEFVAVRDRMISDGKTIKIPAAFFPVLPVPGEVVYATYEAAQMTDAVDSNYKTLRGGNFSLTNPDASPAEAVAPVAPADEVPFA